ncbi:hypothetical protein C0Q70_13712 [Pomacea canaliculata]|uniref:Uncharacterized protein n=1 Tax=Pomacea canaliculata TaxID=400727 RepID=A0A2T7NY07_POMCA|nr:hypothetical protein C0Q70_13712 [Pomacea canaliculata]
MLNRNDQIDVFETMCSFQSCCQRKHPLVLVHGVTMRCVLVSSRHHSVCLPTVSQAAQLVLQRMIEVCACLMMAGRKLPASRQQFSPRDHTINILKLKHSEMGSRS